MNYPGGVGKIFKYPAGIKKQYPESKSQSSRLLISHANRGLEFEAEIEGTHEYYDAEGVGVINKRPTPIRIVRTEYPEGKRKGIRIIDAYFDKKSTVDFEGVSRGIHLEFDAKECREITRFPLDYIHLHQIQHLKKVETQGGIGFLLVKFFDDAGETVYFIRTEQILYWTQQARKSIPRKWMELNCPKVPRVGINRWDYLPFVWAVAKSA